MPQTGDDKATEPASDVRAECDLGCNLPDDQAPCGRSRTKSASKTRKSAMTRARIMAAASQLMAERGGTDFQMSEVSERCHMSKGALYYYFSDRDELTAAIFDESVDELIGDMEAIAARSTTAREALSALYEEFTQRLRNGSPLALAMAYELAGSTERSLPEVTSYFSRASKVIAAQVERAKQEGIVRGDVDSTIVAVFATGGLITTSMAMATGRVTADADTVSAQVINAIANGIGIDGAAL